MILSHLLFYYTCCIYVYRSSYIDQVESTYAYFEETYAAVNEHQLAVGEATCSARFSAWSVDEGGKALLSIDELTRIALERTTNATAAIKLMGSLAEKYGFYGPGFEVSIYVHDSIYIAPFHLYTLAFWLIHGLIHQLFCLSLSLSMYWYMDWGLCIYCGI